MSLYEWKLKYYPTDADDVLRNEALDHSLQKWSGLTAKVRQFFGLHMYKTYWLTDKFDDKLKIAADTCALCEHYFNSDGKRKERTQCIECPLSKVRGGYACDVKKPTERISPFDAFGLNGNAQPMIRLLTRAKELVDKGLIKL